MWLTSLAFWCLRDPRFTPCLGGFGPELVPSLGGGFSEVSHPCQGGCLVKKEDDATGGTISVST